MIHVLVVLGVNINSAMVKLLSPDKYIDINVSVGIISNEQGELLIAKRPAHWMGGGFWEFPGGKIEANEDSEMALKRELLEEVGVIVHQCAPLINLAYVYPERKVTLNAWWVTSYSGIATGLEGQEIHWCKPRALKDFNMLPANRAIVIATQLPEIYYSLSAEKSGNLFGLPQNNLRLIHLSLGNTSAVDYVKLAKEIILHDANTLLMLDFKTIEMIDQVSCMGVHLTTEELWSIKERPLANTFWVSASCHNVKDIKRAEDLKLDFINITSPGSQCSDLRDLIAVANIPVFIKEDLTSESIMQAKKIGAHGISVTS